MKKEILRHAELIEKMTLDEKFCFLTGVDMNASYNMPHFGINSMRFHDSPFGPRIKVGVSEYAAKVRSAFPNAGGGEEAVATAFPTGCALGATWNKELLREVGHGIGAEHKAYGVSALMGPAVNIKRHPLCGRNFEYFSEDPALAGELGAAYVEGAQENGIAACPKHYIANNQERGRFSVSSEMDERTMREIYLAPFERMVTKAHPWSMMCSYNRINGVYASESKLLLDDILRTEWGFDGVIISDWGSVKNRAYSLLASVEMCMPYQSEAYGQLEEAYKNGEITDDDVDGAIDRLLILYDRTCGEPKEKGIDFEAHRKTALQAAREAMTLIKNNGVLPLEKESIKKLFIVGECAEHPYMGGDGSSRVINPPYPTTPLEEIRNILGEDVEINYMSDAQINQYDNEIGYMEGAVSRAAYEADAVVVFASQDYSCYSETMDRNDIELPPYQEHVIRAAHRVNKKVIVVLNVGSAISTYKWKHCADAILVSWLAGQGMGQAVAETLFGLNNPSGKLAETFPKRLSDVPSVQNYPGDFYKTVYKEGLSVGYRHFDTAGVEPDYEFGFGLSYTTFEYNGLKISQTEDGTKVTFNLKNTGDCAGAETAQLYVAAPDTSWLSHPAKELKAFEKVFLEPGEEKEVVMRLTDKDFSYWNPMLHDWVTEPGEYKILVGSSSRRIELCGNVEVKDLHKITFAPSME